MSTGAPWARHVVIHTLRVTVYAMDLKFGRRIDATTYHQCQNISEAQF